MIAGVYNAAAAMDAAERKHELAASNLAHAHLPGYRRRVIDQHSFDTELGRSLIQSAGAHQTAPQLPFVPRIDLTQGSIQATGNPLDIALRGEGYFVVESESGPLYTRNGALRLNEQGELVTVDGLAVRGSGGRLTLPAGSSLHDLHVTPQGALFSGQTEIGQLETVSIADEAPVQSAGASLLTVPDEYVSAAPDVQVVERSLETSNVEPIEELVNILIGSRQYEAAQRIIRSLSDVLQTNIQATKGA